jgi:hypothetical protein
MARELTNKFNEIVTTTIIIFFTDNPAYSEASKLFKEYNRFAIVYNSVSQNLWFGNNADQFILTNDSLQYYESALTNATCFRKNVLPETANWGLPAYLGFTRCDSTALSTQQILSNFNPNDASYLSILSQYKTSTVPRFYYGDANTDSGDNGYWLLPVLPNATVYFLQAPFKINFMGPAYIYMEVDGMNCIDETSPYNISSFTAHTNETNGIVNSCFAKIPVPTTPISQWFDNDMGPYKYYNPPAERIRKLKIKFRYHNGQNVDFGTFEYSFMLEFNLLKNQQERSYSIRDAYSLSQTQAYGK